MDDDDLSVFKTNVTIDQVINFFNLTGENVENSSDISDTQLFDLYEDYKSREQEQLIVYKWIAYILGTLIVVSNLTVVISSGLILRKGQQHKSTYLLLGNVSLADTIIGISIIFGASVKPLISNHLCIFQLGMVVCPAIVSVFSVGLIAVDRYIYILHGLYYQRWFNTTRVRIGIICIWLIGISIALMPATGWINQNPYDVKCFFVAVFPAPVVVFTSILSIIPIILVTVLYSIILAQALKNEKKIKATQNIGNINLAYSEENEKPKLRIYRGSTKLEKKNQNVNLPTKQKTCLKRCKSFNIDDRNNSLKQTKIVIKSRSTEDLNKVTLNASNGFINEKRNNTDRHESNFSVYTIDSSYSSDNYKDDVIGTPSKNTKCFVKCSFKRNPTVKGPNKWRAVTIVMLTSISFVITWFPYFITISVFALCEDKRTNPFCIQVRSILGPQVTLAMANSFLNPLIYAWWHKGFQKFIRSHFRNFFQNYCFRR